MDAVQHSATFQGAGDDISDPNLQSLSLQDSEVYVPQTVFNYDDLFPALPEKELIQMAPQANMGQWNKQMKVRSSVITQVFRVPLEERRYREISTHRFGEQGEQAKICAEIMQKTGAHIEVSSSKDLSLTILVTGKEDAVLKARRMVVNELQTQAIVCISIPKEHHRFILGKSAKKLAELELSTATKISVPRPEDHSDMIKISGTKEGIEKAAHEIQVISDEQAKLAFQRLDIPKIYHPFICGPYNQNITQLMNKTGTRINVPPLSVMKDELTIAGEKEAVGAVEDIIMKIFHEKHQKCQTVSVEVKKAQHKYIIGTRGQNIQEILAQTGVSVEVPSSDSPSETITLRGEQEKLGPGLSLLYEKANSVVMAEVDAPSWLHKYIIGRKGVNIKNITQDMTKVHVEFNNDAGKIKLEGPQDELDKVRIALEKMIDNLKTTITYEEIQVDPKYHRHIIGKSGANVNRLKQETNAMIHIPSDTEHSNIIRIEGNPVGVAQVKQELLDMVHKMENETTRELLIEQRFHGNIIGAKGENIKDIRDRFNQVNINFPEQGIKSDKVIIRGPKEDVENCYRYLSQLNRELLANNHLVEFQVYRQFFKYIIGKGRSIIRKIQAETETKIEIPPDNSDSVTFVITGRKENALAAKEQILSLQNELGNIVDVDIIIPAKFHNSIIGAKGQLIRSIMDECGKVSIKFPPEGSGSDRVTLRGPKEDVDKAKKQLIDLSNEKQLSSYTVELKAKPEHHKFLIGRNGANIKKVREKTGARIVFPTDKDEDRESIIIIGRKEAVAEARKTLEDMVKDLDKVVTTEIKVPPKYHRHFVLRRGEVLRQIAEDFGGVNVSFPRSGSESDQVVLKGAKECVEGAKQRIMEIVSELEAMVTIECIIPQLYHRVVMGAKGHKIQAITQEHNVHIKFPDREARDDGPTDSYQNGEESALNGDVDDVNPNSKPRKSDIIFITGKHENCMAAKEALLNLVPITLKVGIPYDLHRYIIGQKGKDVREMMDRYDVSIKVPAANLESEIIEVSGPPANVSEAKDALLKRVQELEEEKQERVLRSFHLAVEVDPKHHRHIIGQKGTVISKIRQTHKVQIHLPERGDPQQNIITIIGYEENAEAAKEDILKIVQKHEEMVTEEVEIDFRVHSRLIGVRGRNRKKIMDRYDVDIQFPRNSESTSNFVMITGLKENVEDCKDHLLNLEEEYLQDITENEYIQQYMATSSRFSGEESTWNKGESREIIIKGGPWEQSQNAPDTTSTQDFPSFGGGNGPPKPVAWGPRR
ncbi:vigilin-like [Tachypleus tridentatus]|uniref:vigilin-like n=1 Tax=Tachypleus tridentatus TaxID=6853 RepID=UPI003FD04694